MIVGSTPGRYVRFLAQRGLASFGPMRWWLRKVGVRLIDRNAPSKEIMRMLIRELKAGQCVTVFPEGTRSRDGSIAEFRSGLEFLVRRTGAAVVPVGVSGSYKAFGRGARFVWPSKCAVTFGEPWPADKVLADGGIESLRREVSRLAGLPLQEPVATAAPGARGGAAGAALSASAVGPMQSNTNGGGA
jgi:1-acyl-sn-glycerol-3-phosphate acyltransferase